MSDPLLVAEFATPADLVTAWDAELSLSGLLVRGAKVEGASAGASVQVEVKVAGTSLAVLAGSVAAVARIGVAVMFPEVPEGLREAVERARRGEPLEEPAAEEEPVSHSPGTIGDRLAELTVAQKISLAMSGDREARLALLRDHNKVLHAFVLRNPRIQLDEVQFAAKLTTISPDALKAIGEHKEWAANPTVLSSIVRNVRTPMPVALRLLPRLASGEIRAIAKGGARDQLVQAARKILSGGK